MKELTLEEAALAWAQGKRVEASPKDITEWTIISGVGSKTTGSEYSAGVFATNVYRFRLAPEPPAKKWRAYTREELDLLIGETVQRKHSKTCWVIIGVLEEAVHIGNSHYPFVTLLDEFTWSDGSPCGVEVDA